MRLIDADLLTEKVTKWLNPDPNADRMVDIDDIAADGSFVDICRR